MKEVIERIKSFSDKEIAEVPTRFMKLIEEIGEWSAAYLEKIEFKVAKTPKTPEELDDHVLEEGADSLIMVYDNLFKQGYTEEQITAKMSEKLNDWEKVLQTKGLLPTTTDNEVEQESDYKENGKIIQNAMLCKKCGNIITSRDVHDYKECGCDNHVMVDGGGEYFRCSFGENNTSESLQLMDTDDLEVIKNKLIWGTYGKDGNDPLKYVKLIECETEHLQNILANVKHIGHIHRMIITNILVERGVY
jgi:hypothetical protein